MIMVIVLAPKSNRLILIKLMKSTGQVLSQGRAFVLIICFATDTAFNVHYVFNKYNVVFSVYRLCIQHASCFSSHDMSSSSSNVHVWPSNVDELHDVLVVVPRLTFLLALDVLPHMWEAKRYQRKIRLITLLSNCTQKSHCTCRVLNDNDKVRFWILQIKYKRKNLFHNH